MGLNIFSVDKTEDGESTSSDILGRFRSGYQTADKRPVALTEFRITTGDPEVAAQVAEVLGAKEDPKKWDTTTDETFEVFTEASSVDVIVDGTGAIRATLVLWGQNAKILETDGSYLYDDEGNLTEEKSMMTYGKTLKELKALHRSGKGPGPSLAVYFTIPDLGKFRFYSSSWTALENFAEMADLMEDADGPQKFTLELKKVEFEKDGEKISFTKPVLTHRGPA